jgi:pimeloyl-ACP methyl ester carboxylesterase
LPRNAPGADETVLMLHCSTSSSAQWRGLADSLGGSYRAVAPDFFGYGASEPWPGHKSLDLIDQARLAMAAVPGNCRRVHVVGHSFGGAVALRAALELGDRLASLTLIEPSAFHLLRFGQGTDADLFQEVAAVARVVARAVENGHYWSGMSLFTDYWGGPRCWDGLKQETKLKLAQQAPTVLTDFAALFAEPTPIGAYRTLAAPTLILRGTRSPKPSRRICEMLADSMARTRLVDVGDAGHLLPFTHGEAMTAVIAEHLRRSGAAEPEVPAAAA